MLDAIRLLISNAKKCNRCEKQEWTTWTRLLYVYDGDTVILQIWFRGQFVKWRARLMGYDAPELRSRIIEEKQRAFEAKLFLETLLPKRIFRLHVRGLDKYGRLLIDPSYRGIKISVWMINAHHGIPYHGGTKTIPHA